MSNVVKKIGEFDIVDTQECISMDNQIDEGIEMKSLFEEFLEDEGIIE